MADDGLPHLRNALRQGPALRIAQVAPPPPRLVEGPPVHAAPPAASRLTFWQFALRAVPIVVAIISTSVLAYFLLSDRSQPFAQLQQAEAEGEGEQGQPVTREPAPARAEQKRQRQAQAQAQAQQPSAPEPSPDELGPRLAMPNDEKLLLMINSSLIALNQANATGNYSVLREMAAPGFQQANSPERLAQVFSKLRSRNLDLTPILLFQPKLYRKPGMNNRGMIRITGFFPTSPERLNFDLIFQPVHGKWRLYGIAANTQAAQQAQPPQEAAPAPSPAPGAAPAKPEAAVGEPAAPEAAVVKPAAPVKKPAAKPKPAAAESEGTAPPDVRDRIDSPPPAPPAQKPEKKGLWNPFGR